MRKPVILFLLLSAVLTVRAQDPHFWIFLCIGQSNMVGQPPAEAQDYEGVSERFLHLSATDCGDRTQGQWRKALPPLCHCRSGLCPADYFGRTMLRYLPADYRVGVINVAVNGCRIDLFDKDQAASVMAQMTQSWQQDELSRYDFDPWGRLTDMARRAQQDGVIKGILLQQGETDAYTTYWFDEVNKVYNDLCAELSLGAVPITVGQVLANGASSYANHLINQVESHVANAHLVSSEGCTVWPDDGQNVHFDAASQRLLGQRHALKMLEALGIDTEATGLAAPPAQADSAQHKGPWHNLQGQTLQEPARPGCYIKDGKKTIVR